MHAANSSIRTSPTSSTETASTAWEMTVRLLARLMGLLLGMVGVCLTELGVKLTDRGMR